MNEIQLQKLNSNIFCYVEFVAQCGKIIVKCQGVEYNPETEENTNLDYHEFDLAAFQLFMANGRWIVCTP